MAGNTSTQVLPTDENSIFRNPDRHITFTLFLFIVTLDYASGIATSNEK